jgi:hypothetical protein
MFFLSKNLQLYKLEAMEDLKFARTKKRTTAPIGLWIGNLYVLAAFIVM